MMCFIYVFFWIWTVFVYMTNFQCQTKAQTCGVLRVTPRIAFERETVTFSYQLLVNGSGNRLFKYHNVEVYPNTKSPDVRIEMKRDHTNISYTLKDVRKQDAGNYTADCGQSFGPTSSVELDVKAYPTMSLRFKEIRNISEINCHNCLLGWEGRHMNIECILKGISSSDELDVNIFLEKDGVRIDQSSITTSSPGPFIQASFGLEPTIDLDMQMVRCLLLSSRLSQNITTEATLRILRPPSVPIFKSIVKENEDVFFTCRSPKDVTTPILKIKYNNTERISDWTGSETSQSWRFSRYDNGRPLRCCLEYRSFEKGKHNSTNTVCGPENIMDVRYTASNVSLYCEHLNGSTDGNAYLELKCSASESNPRSDISWISNSQLHLFGNTTEHLRNDTFYRWTVSNSLKLNITRRHNRKSISCVVTHADFPEWRQIREYHVNITYHPYITISGADGTDTLVAYDDETINIECEADANPVPIVKWFHNSSTLSGDRWLKLNADASMKPGRYIYTCSASNGVGPRHVNKTITLLVKTGSERPGTTMASTTANDHILSVVMAVVGGIIAIVVVVLTVYCVKRRRQTKRNIDDQLTSNKKRTDGINKRRPGENVDVTAASELETAEYASVVAKHQRSSLAQQPKLLTTRHEGNMGRELVTRAEVQRIVDDGLEYSAVVPRDARVPSVQQNQATENATMIYADLDLSPGNATVRILNEEAATTYVSIDFAATEKEQKNNLRA
ncbi:uncharacterized protein LOC127831757 isoform X2 [Dreissena polymorpha]|uniref:uncharacterized protein LOC127831757 isoform X2 n=1 Tax=Dreissena polymorpha TaxID=45954 RepID=UPI002264504C|nr:uncharacterized protein LOC127831757 isoform X2 [Dreissena polymorpha]